MYFILDVIENNDFKSRKIKNLFLYTLKFPNVLYIILFRLFESSANTIEGFLELSISLIICFEFFETIKKIKSGDRVRLKNSFIIFKKFIFDLFLIEVSTIFLLTNLDNFFLLKSDKILFNQNSEI